MSALANARRTRVHSRPAWSGLAVVVEAIMLLLFLVGSLAILTQLFAASATRGQQGRDLAAAVSLATSAAERFSAHPDAAEEHSVQDGYAISCEVEPEVTDAGTLYHATITVSLEGQDTPLYTLETARYQREVK